MLHLLCCTWRELPRSHRRGQSLLVMLLLCPLPASSPPSSRESLLTPHPAPYSPELSPALMHCTLRSAVSSTRKATPTHLPCKRLQVSPRSPSATCCPVDCALWTGCMSTGRSGWLWRCDALCGFSLVSKEPLPGTAQSESPPCPAQARAEQGPSKRKREN